MNPTDLLDGNACIVGLQWGDEGKGKIVDFLSEKAEVVVRYCGGANAGHTVHFGGKKYSTHLLPVGVFRPGVMNLIANGVVMDPVALFKEIDENTAKGFSITPANLRVSYKTHVVMPYHQTEDSARETAAGDGSIGTTRRGIGPTYADKAHRSTAIRVGDLIHPDRLAAKLQMIVAERNTMFAALYKLPPIDWKEIHTKYAGLGQRLAPFVDDTSRVLIDAWKAGKKIVFEGAHANLLDIDHGTYPFVTSSSCSALGLFTGAGAPPQCVKNFVGIMKPYCTRVGGGPFPTEQENATGEYIRTRGREYGTTTGRPRRCGWFDAVATKYSVELNGINAIALTLLDVLSGLDEIKICTSYTLNGKPLNGFRADMDTLAGVEAIYETVPGWKEEITACRDYADLPANAKKYVERLEALVGARIAMISVGAERDATLGAINRRRVPSFGTCISSTRRFGSNRPRRVRGTASEARRHADAAAGPQPFGTRDPTPAPEQGSSRRRVALSGQPPEPLPPARSHAQERTSRVNDQPTPVADRPVYVGIDVSKDRLDIARSDSADRWSVPNDPDGIAKLLTLLLPWRPTRVAVESTGKLERPLLAALLDAGLNPCHVNPQRVRQFARATGRAAKTDALDAAALAGFAEHAGPRPAAATPQKQAELAELVACRRQLIDTRTAHGNQLRTVASAFAADRLKAVLEHLDGQIDRLDERIAELIEGDDGLRRVDRVLRSVAGVGPVLAATILAQLREIGTLGHKPLTALVGLAPFNNDSGRHRGRRSIRGGRTAVRNVLYVATISAIRANAAIKAKYHALPARGKAKKVAIIACCHKLLRVLNALVRDELRNEQKTLNQA